MQSLSTNWQGHAFPISPAQITAVINHTSGGSTASARFKLLDRNFAVVPTGALGPYGDDGDVTRSVSACTITHDTTQDVHRTATITIDEGPNNPYNALYHYVQVFMDYWAHDGSLLFEVPLGVFKAVEPNRSLNGAWITDQLNMLDLTSRLSGLVFLNTWVFKSGSVITGQINALAQQSYLPSVLPGGTAQTPAGQVHCGPNIQKINGTPSTVTLPADVTAIRGDNQLAQINSFLDTLTYYHIWFDGMGVMRYSPRPNLSVSTPTPGWSYHTGASSIIEWPVTDSAVNWAKLANIILVEAANPSTATLVSYAYNDNNQTSLIGLDVLGEAIPAIIRDPNISTQALADARSHIELQAADGLQEKLTFQTMINPFHESSDALDVLITADDGTVLVNSSDGFEEIGWSIDCFALTQTHTISRYSSV